MRKILPFLFFGGMLNAQNANFKKLLDDGDRKYAVKSYKQAYIDYEGAYKLISADIEKMVSDGKQAGPDQKDWLNCLVKHARCAHYSGNRQQATSDAFKLLAIDSANADAKAIKAFDKYKSGDKLNSCIEMRRQQKGSEMADKMFNDCFCWGEGVFVYREANSAFSLSKNQEALDFVNQAIEILPDSLAYRVKKGQILCKMEKYKEAITIFSDVIKKDGKHFDALYLRGIAFLKDGRTDSAFKDLTECIKLNSYNYNAYRQRAEICMEMKEFQSAIYDYQQCIRLKPEDAELHYKIAMIKKDDIQDELGGCEEFLKAAAMGYEEAKEYAEACKHPKKKKK